MAQFSPRFDGQTECPACKAALRIRRKASNYLVPAYLATLVAVPFVMPGASSFDSYAELLPLAVLAFIQIRSVEYETVVGPDPLDGRP
jgi:hypothetical protein